jgi:glycosyltransferase involved in cell wall biosynthesis
MQNPNADPSDKAQLFDFLKWNSYFSARHKLFYVSTPKVACTSIKWWFAAIEDYTRKIRATIGSSESDPDLIIHDLFWKVAPHITGLTEEGLEDAVKSEDVFRFAVVRNPYKRIFSAWQSKLVLREPLQIGPYTEQPFFNRPLETWDDIASGFESFLRHLADNEAPSYWDNHWRPQTSLLRPDVISYNRISQLEDTGELVSDLASWLGKGIPSPFLTRRTNESLIPYQREFLTPLSVRLIQELYAEDFERFHYEIEAPESRSGFSQEQLDVALLGIEALRKRHQRMGERTQEIRNLYVTLQQRDGDIQFLTDSNSSLGAEIARIGGELQSRVEEIGSLNQSIVEIVSAKGAEIEALQQTNAAQQAQIGDITSNLQAQLLKLNAADFELNTAKIELGAARAEMDALLEVSAGHQAETERQKSENLTLREEIEDLIETKHAEIDALRAEMDSLQQLAGSYEAETGIYRSENAALHSQLAEFRVARLKAKPTGKGKAFLKFLGMSGRPRNADIEAIRNSPYFDSVYYVNRYPDVATAKQDPAQHYLVHGWREGRDPSIHFSTLGYLDAYPDVAGIGMNPLLHYLKHGQKEHRGTGQDLSPDNPVLASELAALNKSDLFDRQFYLARYPDVASSKLDPAIHYLVYGWREGRDPSAGFHAASYLAKYPDVATAVMNPLVHFLRHGQYEGREIVSLAAAQSGFLSGGASWSPKKNAKAVFVVHDLNIGGAPVLLANIARWFQNHTAYDVRIVSMTGGPLSKVMEEIAPLYIVGTRDVADNAVADLQSQLHTFIGEEPAFTFVNSVAAGGYFKINPFKAPTFAYIHEMPAILKLFDKQLKDILSHSDHIFCGGAKVYQHFAEVEDVSKDKLSNIPAFIDEPAGSVLLTAADKIVSRKRLGVPEKSRLVVGCGVAHWRKQPEIFVRMAADIVLKRGHDARFIWVGDGEDIRDLRKLSTKMGVDHLVDFVGHKENFRDYLEAADVFALPSSEDPFPLVCLEAGLVGAPSVVFREATGMTAMIEPEGLPPAGIAVPLGDEQAFFDAVDQLLSDETMRTAMSQVARERVLSNYSTRTGSARLLSTIRRVADLRPLVSVVVPSYNCGPYLQQRLDSIANQTFKDIEILLLDDASKDNSQEILSEFAKTNVEAKLFFAEKNGGSVFKAWQRGIDLAEGELVWLAEADDWCEPDFLHRAVAAFSQPGVRLVHGRSIPVNSQGEIAGDWNDLYLDRIAPGRWTKSFTAPAYKEVNATLGRANTIPNASAVVTRRASAKRAINLATQFKLAGDWAYYLTAIAGGRIAYCHEAVNYHRRHDTSVTAGIEGKDAYFQELQNVGALVDGVYGENTDRRAAFDAHIGQEAKRFGWNNPLPEPKAPEGTADYRHPGVIYGVGDLSAGGAQMFAVRFVNRWTELPASAVLFVAEHEPANAATIKYLSPEVAVVTARDVEAAGGLENFMDDWGLELAISGHWWGDRAISRMIADSSRKIPWFTVMHGCHENVLSSPKSFPTMREDFARAEKYCDHWIWTAEKNKKVFSDGHVKPKSTSHIVNGFTPVSQFRLERAELGIAEDALVFTIASRAIESKGWNAALAAFQDLRKANGQKADIHLLMIGDGPASDAIRSKPEIPGVHLVRHTSRLADFIHISDVCLLPSWFAGESLPLVLIEFLAQGKPAIVSDIGMCSWAIGEGTQARAAGMVVARDKTGKVPQKDLANAMDRFVADPHLKDELKSAAEEAFKKFDMDNMIYAYRDLAVDILGKGR